MDYFLKKNSRKFRMFIAKDDNEAGAVAQRYVDGADIELWQGDRLIKTIPSVSSDAENEALAERITRQEPRKHG
jgi:hypothetical protein